MFSSYADAAEFFSKCRCKELGRPVNCAGTRLHKDGEDYTIKRYNVPVCRITPENKLVFIVDREAHRRIAASLSATIDRFLPFIIKRVGVGRYKVAHISQLRLRKNAPNWAHSNLHRAKYFSNIGFVGDELFLGIVFNLSTGVCENPKPPLEKLKPDKEKRKLWLERSKTFKRHVELMLKMGVFDGHLAKSPEASGWGRATSGYPQIIEDMLRDGVPSMELIKQVCDDVKQRTYYWGKEHRTPRVRHVLLTALKHQSLEIRRQMGVFPNE